jgi:probable F420-dependent oxidoreductase
MSLQTNPLASAGIFAYRRMLNRKTPRENDMQFGGAMFFTDYSMSAMELARVLEERGFESVWAPEHSHIPLSRKTPFPGGGDLPKQYYDAMDPFVVLAAASQVTKTIKLGTGVLLVQQRDAIQTAKLVASIDQVSQGRFLFGVGGGWNQDEMENHGTVYNTRFKRMRESIEAMKEIWTKPESEYHGEFVNFDPIIARPKPVRQPYPPIHVGGAFPHGARRAIRYGDGWIPTAGRGDIVEVLPKFRDMAREAGRDPASIEISLFGLGDNVDRVKRLAELGVTRVVPMFPAEKAATVQPIIDRWTEIMRQVNG